MSSWQGGGAAGAFIVSRAEIADSMGGGAIAISLVPPLCVVGIAISQGEWQAAGGAILLFLTNFFAILFAGGLVFMALGLGRVALEQSQVKLRRRSFVLIIVGTLLVTLPLCLTGYRAVTETIATNKATAVVEEWLQDGTGHFLAVALDGRKVIVSVEGTGNPQSVDELAAELEKSLGYPVTVNLHNNQDAPNHEEVTTMILSLHDLQRVLPLSSFLCLLFLLWGCFH